MLVRLKDRVYVHVALLAPPLLQYLATIKTKGGKVTKLHKMYLT